MEESGTINVNKMMQESLKGNDGLAKLQSCQYLVMSGGAAKGIAMCSAITTLIDIHKSQNGGNLLSQLKGAAGTSIGSCLALACVCAPDWPLMKSYALDEHLWDGNAIFRDIDFFRVNKSKGLCTHKALYQSIDRLFELLGLELNIDFETLYKRTQKKFICNAACTTNSSILYMSHETTPYLSVRDALCMSMCVPLLFVPFEYQGSEYLDGALFANYIVEVFPPETTIGISAAPPSSVTVKPEKNGIMWILQLLTSMTDRIDILRHGSMAEKYKESTIFIYTEGNTSFNFTVDKETMKLLWDCGETSTIWYLFKEKYVGMLIKKRLEKNLKK